MPRPGPPFTNETVPQKVKAAEGLPAVPCMSGATFGDACDEWLRYVEHDRQRRPSTVKGYGNTVERVLKPTFGADTRSKRSPPA